MNLEWDAKRKPANPSCHSNSKHKEPAFWQQAKPISHTPVDDQQPQPMSDGGRGSDG